MLRRQPRLDSTCPSGGVFAVPFSRREALRCAVYGAAGVGLAGAPARALWGAAVGKQPPTKSVIQIWMWGGPTHLDTFDPKPKAGHDYCGPLDKPIATNVDGIQIGELLPLLAKQADKYTLIRSMSHGVNAHETAAYMVQTGRMQGDRNVYPSVGAVVSLFKGYSAGYEGMIPPYIVLTEPLGRFSEAGFLGARYKPFSTGGDPGKTRFEVEGVVAPGVTDQRQRERRDLLAKVNTLRDVVGRDASVEAFNQSEHQAYDMILGDGAKVFDLTQEKDEVREQYGKNTFGQSCLMARRLVERGVPYVTINYKGWDTHKEHFQIMRRKLPEFDRGLSSLLTELTERGLLESTIVWCCGEFGRTPRVLWEPPWNGGRGHHGKVFSALLAGGGFKGGHVLGSSDDKGDDVRDRPVHPSELIGTIYRQLGIKPDAKLPHPQGQEITVAPPIPEGKAPQRLLNEIT